MAVVGESVSFIDFIPSLHLLQRLVWISVGSVIIWILDATRNLIDIYYLTPIYNI